MTQNTDVTTDRFADLREQFTRAWPDLGERIDGGVAGLTHMASRAAGDNAERLTAKADGLRAAQALYVSLDPTGKPNADYAGAWRLFEDAIATRVRQEPSGPFQQGLSLANDYQRGYGADVDAAPLFARSR